MVKVGERSTPSSRREMQPLLAAGSLSRAKTGRAGSPMTKSPAGLGAPPKASSWTDQLAKSPAEKSAKFSSPRQSRALGFARGNSAITDWIFFSKEAPDFWLSGASSFVQANKG